MRLLVDVRSLVPPLTGVGRYTLSIVGRLAADPEVAVTLLGPPPCLGEAARAGVGAATRETRHSLQDHPWVELEELFCRGAWLRETSPELVWGPAFVLPPAPPGRAAVTVHDLAAFRFPGTVSRAFGWLVRTHVARAVARAGRVLVPSEPVRGQLLERFPGARVEVVREGVGPRFLQVDDDEASRVRERLGLPEEYLLAVGGAHPRKGLGPLLEALGTLPGAPPLVVAGRPAPDPAPGLVPLGPVGDDLLPGLYRGSLGLVFPSLDEGFGLPPLEALATGIPALSSRVGAAPTYGEGELVLVGAGAGTDELRAGVEALLAAPRGGEAAARRRARAGEWSWEAAAADHLRVLRELGEGR